MIRVATSEKQSKCSKRNRLKIQRQISDCLVFHVCIW